MKHAVVVACTNGKSAPPAITIRQVRRSMAPVHRTADLFAAWTQATCEVEVEPVRAQEFYNGVAWSESLRIREAAKQAGLDADCFVMSAGYGLIRWDDAVAPYSATFSPPSAKSMGPHDSVATGPRAFADVNREWWGRLTRWNPGFSGPRSLAAAMARYDKVMVVASPRYLDAASQDLMGAPDSDRLVLVSGGLRESSPLSQWGVPFDRRLREADPKAGTSRLVEASDMSLNQAVARHLIRTLGVDAFDREAARNAIDAEMSARQQARTYDRAPATDDEVIEFIARHMAESPKTTKTHLLRLWRDGMDRACEQKRFGRLFLEAKEAIALAQPGLFDSEVHA